MTNATSPQDIKKNFKGKDILSLDQFSKDDLHILFDHAKTMRNLAINSNPSTILSGPIVTLVFYEPSSRTFSSFSAATKRLGGQTIEYQNPLQVSSAVKGETLEDTVRVFEAYSEAIVIRHPEIGTAQKAANACEFAPVINAGDGIGEHPTQALLDLFTIQERFGRLTNLKALLAGDALNSRTMHSLIKGLSLFKGNTLYLLSPEKLKLPKQQRAELTKGDIHIIEITSEKDIPKDCNFWYWTRVPKKRFASLEEYEQFTYPFVITPQLLEKYGNKDMILMDPLPRIKTIDTSIDADPRAVYLRSQVRNGMYVRMALLALVLGKIK